jgi:hypothetical protein
MAVSVRVAGPAGFEPGLNGRIFDDILEGNRLYWRRHGTGLRYLRQRSAVWEQHLARAQYHQAALECESAPGEGQGWGRGEAAAGLQQLFEGR